MDTYESEHVYACRHMGICICVCKSMYMHMYHARPVTTEMNVISVMTRRVSVNLRNSAVGCLECRWPIQNHLRLKTA